MGDGGNVYLCPVCDKPFDMDDKLADFALAAHEKDHKTMRPERLMVRRDGVWVCNLCDEPLNASKEMARIAMASHMKEHGVRPQPSTPDMTRGGQHGGRSGFSGHLVDLAEGAADAVGSAIGRILDRTPD